METNSSRLFSKVKQRNPVSTWIGERLTLLGVVDFSCIFFLFLCPFCFLFLTFSLILLSLSNKSVCICSADAFSYPMTCLGYVFTVNGKIIQNFKIVVSRRICIVMNEFRGGSGASV